VKERAIILSYMPRQSGTNESAMDGGLPKILHSTLPWHCLGAAQRGRESSTRDRLKDVVILERSASVAEQGRAVMLRVAESDDERQTDAALAAKMYSLLRQLGFTGCEGIPGYHPRIFLSPRPIVVGVAMLWVSTTISWRVLYLEWPVVRLKGQKSYIPGGFQDLYQTKSTEEVISRRTLESFDVHTDILVMIKSFLSATSYVQVLPNELILQRL